MHHSGRVPVQLFCACCASWRNCQQLCPQTAQQLSMQAQQHCLILLIHSCQVEPCSDWSESSRSALFGNSGPDILQLHIPAQVGAASQHAASAWPSTVVPPAMQSASVLRPADTCPDLGVWTLLAIALPTRRQLFVQLCSKSARQHCSARSHVCWCTAVQTPFPRVAGLELLKTFCSPRAACVSSWC